MAAAITGLPAGATIYYRVSAANGYGTTSGAVRTFAIPAAAVPIVEQCSDLFRISR